MNFYPVKEWPHVAILDPRTGQKLVTWSTIKDGNTFCDLVTEFLTLHPPYDEKVSEPPSKRAKSSGKNGVRGLIKKVLNIYALN